MPRPGKLLELLLKSTGRHTVTLYYYLLAEIFIYRARSLYTKDEAEAEVLKELWQTAHDICSLAACNFAFDGCKDNDEYDLG